MDLWIRSQDKMNLVKVNQVNVNYQNNNQIIANYIPDFVETQGEYYEALGTYATKERALEVLNDIQNKVCGNAGMLLATNSGIKPTNIAGFSYCGVYEMPKE